MNNKRKSSFVDIATKQKDLLYNTMVFTENMNDAYSDSANLDKCLKTVDSKDLENSAVDKKNSIINKFEAGDEEKLDNKRRASEAVRLEFLPNDIPRRLTKANMDNKILKLLNFTMHRPSMFVPARLGSIQECVNESQEKIPSYETTLKCTTDKNLQTHICNNKVDNESHSVKIPIKHEKNEAPPHSALIEKSPANQNKILKEDNEHSESSVS